MKYERTLERAVDLSPTHTRNLNAMQTNRLSHFLRYAYAANESTGSVHSHSQKKKTKTMRRSKPILESLI